MFVSRVELNESWMLICTRVEKSKTRLLIISGAGRLRFIEGVAGKAYACSSQALDTLRSVFVSLLRDVIDDRKRVRSRAQGKMW